MMGIFADQIYLKGLQDNEITYFKLSRTIFPYDKEIITSEALSYIRNKIVNEKVYPVLKEALKNDPYSVEMLGMYVQYAKALNDPKEAEISYSKLKQISPNMIKKLASVGVKF